MRALTLLLGLAFSLTAVAQSGQAWTTNAAQTLAPNEFNPTSQGTNGGSYVQGLPGGASNPIPVTSTVLDPCQSATVAKSNSAISVSSATTVVLISSSGSTQTFVCGYSTALEGTSPSVQLEYGTGNSCTTPTAFTGVITGASGEVTNVSSAGGGYTVFTVPVNNNLCAVTTGSSGVVTFNGSIQFVRQ